MILQIHIQNLITIKELNLDILPGMTVITGETGAGKSILIDAIELALGKRAAVDIIRADQEKVDISLCFDVSKNLEARAWLKSFDLETENGECILRRTINRDGRSRSYINNMPTTLQPLRELSELLINIHGQHEHQSLLKTDTQRVLLDRFGGHQHLVDQVHVLSEDWHQLAKEISQLKKSADEKKSREDFLKFQLKDLEDLHLTPDEFQHLDMEHKQLANAGDLLQNVNIAVNALAENENQNALGLLNEALHALETVQRVHPKISGWIESLKSAVISVSDTEDELRRYLESVDLDPERLQWVENRISTLFNIARKHKIAPHELYDLQLKFSQELFDTANSDEKIAALIEKQKIIEKKYQESAALLSDGRKKSAKKLSAEITKTVRELSMPHAEFFIELEKENPDDFPANGLEKIIFQIKTNAGLTAQPLAKIASGGELSRISLAIHAATASQYTIPTLIFDEVDVGIGGGTAEIVGKLLRRLGSTHQVFCITHAPQVAAQGHSHLRVEKMSDKHSTSTTVTALSPKEKISEIARMLGGVEVTKKTMEHAKEMVEKLEC
jgi:DNA repair protein RecN (Recombination protein N)